VRTWREKRSALEATLVITGEQYLRISNVAEGTATSACSRTERESSKSSFIDVRKHDTVKVCALSPST